LRCLQICHVVGVLVGMVGLDAGLVVFCDVRVYEPGGFWWDATVWVFGLGAKRLCVHVIPAALS
jgi:hypothetical protein